MRSRLASAMAVLLVTGFLLACNGSSSSDSQDQAGASSQSEPVQTPPGSADSPTAAEPTIEYQLAVIHSEDNSLDSDDPLVGQFSDLLDSIESKTTNTRTEIADISVAAWQDSESMGYPDSLLQTMQNLDNSMPEGSESLNLDFVEVAAVYLTLLDS